MGDARGNLHTGAATKEEGMKVSSGVCALVYSFYPIPHHTGLVYSISFCLIIQDILSSP